MWHVAKVHMQEACSCRMLTLSGYKASVLFGQGTGLEAQQLHGFPATLSCETSDEWK